MVVAAGPVNTLSRRLLAETESLADFLKTSFLHESQYHRVAVRLAEVAHGFLQQRGDLLPNRIGLRRVHFRQVFETLMSPTFCPEHLGRRKTCGPIQPAGHDGFFREAARLASEKNEHGLRHFLCLVRIGDQSARR